MHYKKWFYQDQAGDSTSGGGVADTTAGATGGDTVTGGAGGTPKIWPDDWRKQLAGEDAASIKQLERFQSPTDVWKKTRSLEQRFSSGELKSSLPKDATPEQVALWRTENGIPDKADGYDIKGLVAEEDLQSMQGFLAQMHNSNASPSVVKAGVEWMAKEAVRLDEEAVAKDREFAKQSEDALRAEWGNEYRVNVNKINGLLEMAPSAVRDDIAHGRLANGQAFMANPEVMKWLSGLARQINPVTTIIPGAGANIGSAIEDEIGKIEKVMSQDRKTYNEDEKMQGRLRELYEARERLGQKK